MITDISFVIAVKDLERSSEYYRDHLGFEIHTLGGPGWMCYVKDACRILAGHCPDALSPAETGDHSYFAYLTVDDIDKFYSTVSARGTEIVKEIRDEPWGMREFGLRTLDGHRIMFGMKIPDSIT